MSETTNIKAAVETHAIAYWRQIDAFLAAEGEPPATAAEIAAHGVKFRAAERAVFSIIRQRITSARADLPARNTVAALEQLLSSI